MPHFIAKPSLPLPRESGFTLVEVMVAIVILSFGLLGVAGLMVMGIQNTYSSQQRSTATQLAYDMIDRMRSNEKGVELAIAGVGGNYNRPATTVTGANGPYTSQKVACIGATGFAVGCSAANMADNDAYEWQQEIKARLGDGVAIVCLDSSSAPGTFDGATIVHGCDGVGPKYAIKIYWRDDRTATAANKKGGSGNVVATDKYVPFVMRFLP